MIKNIALATVFAAVSVVSFTASSVNAAKPVKDVAASMSAPVMNGMCPGSGYCR